MSVTFQPKCYITACVGCGCLFDADRSDKITCSGACRVRAHRGKRLPELRRLAESMKITVAQILQAEATQQLRPDVVDQITAGTMTYDDALPALYDAYMERVMKAVSLSKGDAA